MSKPYEDIPLQGRHKGAASGEEPTTSVRGQRSPLAPPPADEELPATYQLSHHNRGGHYRIRSWTSEDAGNTEDEYREIGRYDAPNGAIDAIASRAHRGQFIVMENSKTGEVVFDEEAQVSDNWPGDGQYDQITLFEDASEAAAYVERRQSER